MEFRELPPSIRIRLVRFLPFFAKEFYETRYEITNEVLGSANYGDVILVNPSIAKRDDHLFQTLAFEMIRKELFHPNYKEYRDLLFQMLSDVYTAYFYSKIVYGETIDAKIVMNLPPHLREVLQGAILVFPAMLGVKSVEAMVKKYSIYEAYRLLQKNFGGGSGSGGGSDSGNNLGSPTNDKLGSAMGNYAPRLSDLLSAMKYAQASSNKSSQAKQLTGKQRMEEGSKMDKGEIRKKLTMIGALFDPELKKELEIALGLGINWKELLRGLVYEAGIERVDYDFTQVDRRSLVMYEAMGIDVVYPKKVRAGEKVKLYILIDSSSSITDEEYSEFVKELLNLVKTYNVEGKVILFTAGINKVIKVTPQTSFATLMASLRGRYGGGTNLTIPLRFVEKDAIGKFVNLVIFTDGYHETIDESTIDFSRFNKILYLYTEVDKNFRVRKAMKVRLVI